MCRSPQTLGSRSAGINRYKCQDIRSIHIATGALCTCVNNPYWLKSTNSHKSCELVQYSWKFVERGRHSANALWQTKTLTGKWLRYTDNCFKKVPLSAAIRGKDPQPFQFGAKYKCKSLFSWMQSPAKHSATTPNFPSATPCFLSRPLLLH